MKLPLLILLAVINSLVAQAQTGQAPVPSPAPSQVQPSNVAARGATSRGNIVIPQEKAQPSAIPRFQKPPTIDGHLDDEAWKGAVILRDFHQIRPGDNIPPSQPTEVLIGYDEKAIYFAFRAHDEAGKVRATIAKRDAIFDDDYVAIYLDTFNDQRKAYGMFFNPLGVQADGIYTEGVGDDFSVDLVMESRGVITDDGYTIEVAIPFKSLRYVAGKDKAWGIHLQRSIKRFNDEVDSWMPISRDKSNFLGQEGHINGLEDIWSGRTLEIIPSLTLSETGRRVRTLTPAMLGADPTLLDPGRFVNQPLKNDPGVNVKLGLTPNITLDFAVNPDFAQVEADQTVVTANQRFPIFFEEKRPFFLEGIDIFQTALRPVHTRAIIDPDFAAKLTGKLGRNSFGLLLASDNAPGDFNPDERLDPSNLRFLDKNAYIGILRLKRDIGAESSIGMVATSYNFIEKHNQLAGIDGRFRLDPQTVFSFQALGTTSRRFFFDPDLAQNVYRTGNAFGYYWNYDKAKRHLNYTFSGSGRTRDYRADVGFTPRTNTNREDFFLRYNSEPNPKAKLVSWRIFYNLGTNFDWQGRMQNWGNAFQFRVNLQRQTTLNVGYSVGYERVFEEEFGAKRASGRVGAFAGDDPERSTHKRSLTAYGTTTPHKQFSLFFNVDYLWNVFDFDFGSPPRFPRVSPPALADQQAPLDPGPGRELFIQLNPIYQPTNSLRIDLSYTKDRLTRNDTGRVAFDENIFALRTTYQFTRFTFARLRVDYDTLDSNVRGQLLFGWTPNPGTSFYVGYNDDLNYKGFNPFTDQHESGFRRNRRTFFIKLSYLFRRSF